MVGVNRYNFVTFPNVIDTAAVRKNGEVVE